MRSVGFPWKPRLADSLLCGALESSSGFQPLGSSCGLAAEAASSF